MFLNFWLVFPDKYEVACILIEKCSFEIKIDMYCMLISIMFE